jgi:hypothetical protein
MDVSRGALRRRLLAMRAWDSQGKSLDDKINEAIDQALDRMATDIPEALLPDEEHVTLRAPVKSGDEDVKTYVRVCAWDKRLLEFVDARGVPIDSTSSKTAWRPNCSGEWDGIMHIEVKGPSGRWHRRQCREFFYYDVRGSDHVSGGKVETAPGVKDTHSKPETDGRSGDLSSEAIDFIKDHEYYFNAKVVKSSGQKLEAEVSDVTAFAPQSRQALAIRLGVPVNAVSDATYKRYLQQNKNPQQKFTVFEAGERVALPAVMLQGDHGAVSGQSADANNGVDGGQGLTNNPPKNQDSGTLVSPTPIVLGKPYGASPGLVVGSGGSSGSVKVKLVTPKDITGGFYKAVPITLLSYKAYLITIDRPWRNNTDGWLSGGALNTGTAKGLIASLATEPMEFRIYQPEFFTRDDVMELNEPAVIWDGSRQQVWGIDTAGADRADMRDYQGEVEGRPVRMYRGRHFQLPAPTVAPMLDWNDSLQWTRPSLIDVIPRGSFRMCYTYVWGRRDLEWQQAPNVAPMGHDEYNPNQKMWWSHDAGLTTLMSSHASGLTGISDPVWESAPSPISDISHKDGDYLSTSALVVRATNIDAMLGFSNPYSVRFSHTGLRLRFYIAYSETVDTSGTITQAETSEDRFYLLCEVEPTYDQLTGWMGTACRFVIDGNQFWDIERPLRHSTGYFAWKTYPAHDERYELDLRVTRLPKRLADDQDTPPIQRGAVSALVELAAHYVALLDGADQGGAQIHLDRYTELIKVVRSRYANPGKVVEPKSLAGGVGRSRHNRFGTFDS